MWDMLQLVSRHFRCYANFSGLALRRLPCTKLEKHFLRRLCSCRAHAAASLARLDKLKHAPPKRHALASHRNGQSRASKQTTRAIRFSGFVSRGHAAAKPEKFDAYRGGRLENPPAARIGCSTKGQSRAASLARLDKLKHVLQRRHG